MLNWSAALLRIQRGTILELAKSAGVQRHFCRETSSTSGERGGDDTPKEYSVDDFKRLVETEELTKKCHLILLEIASLREENGRAPNEIRERDMRDLLTFSVNQRMKYYDYMFKREMSKRNAMQKRILAREEREKLPREHNTPTGLYPFLRKSSQFRSLQGKLLAQAALFGQKVIFDCGYDDNMSNREQRRTAEQIQMAYSINRYHPNPFDLNICNLKKNSHLEEVILQTMAMQDVGNVLLGMTEKSYLDLYPKKDLLYLSPHAIHPLKDWDHSTIFIIGALVDLGAEKPLSLAKAKKEGIACARFPIQERVVLRGGAQKTLTLNAVLDILLTLRQTNDWGAAFDKLPRRFVADMGQSLTRQRRIQNSVTRRKSLADMV